MAEVIHFQEPSIDARLTPEQNLQIVYRWAVELVRNLNLMQARSIKEQTNGNE